MKQPVILRIFKESTLVEVKQFDQDQIIFGRPGSEVDVFLDDESVSPIHCLIEKRNDEQYHICDLGSQSGVYLNKSAILDEMIDSGSQIQLGLFRIDFFVGVPKPKAAPHISSATQSAVATLKVEAKKSSVPLLVPVAEETVTQGAHQEKSSPQVHELPKEEPKRSKIIEESPLKSKIEEKVKLTTKESKKELSEVKKTKEETLNIPQGNVSSSHSSGKRWIRKKATFSTKSEINQLSSYLKPSSGTTIQVILAWKERILDVFNYTRNQGNVIVGKSKLATLPSPQGYGDFDFLLVKRVGQEMDVFAPVGCSMQLVTPTVTFSHEELKKMGRLQVLNQGFLLRLQNNELVHIVNEHSNIEIFVRRMPEGLPIRPMGFIDLSSSEVTGMIVSLVVVALMALYMSVYTPQEKEELLTEEVRLAQFIYNKPPEPPKPPEPLPPPPKEETPPPPPPPPKPVEPKKIKVTDEKPKEMAQSQPKQKSQNAQSAGGRAQEVKPMPSKVVRPKTFTSTKQGGSVKMGQNEGANAASAQPDVSNTGLLSAFGGGGNRSRLDKVYSGGGELLGMANKASGYSGQNSDREGEDIGSKFKDTGAGGKGVETQGIANLGTKGRSSGMLSYGAVGPGDGKGRVSIDIPGSEAAFEGSIDKEAVRKVIRSIISQIRACYEKKLRTNPSLGGKLVITFEIAEQGRVSSAKTKSNTLGDPEVGQCVADRIQAQRFPEPPAGTIAVVDYPFVFDSQK